MLRVSVLVEGKIISKVMTAGGGLKQRESTEGHGGLPKSAFGHTPT